MKVPFISFCRSIFGLLFPQSPKAAARQEISEKTINDSKVENVVVCPTFSNRIRIFHPINSLAVSRYVWLILLSEI
jgi:hypothetical protein